MPNLVIAQNVPQPLIDRIVAAFVDRQGPVPMTPGMPEVLDGQGNVVTPGVPPAQVMTDAQFAQKKIMEYVKNVVANSEREVAAKSVVEAAQQKTVNDFSGV